jgi:ribosomal protein L35AE/L33A
MSKSEGCWLVVLLLPRLQNRVLGRYRIRSDAELHAGKLRRILGDRGVVRVMFES